MSREIKFRAKALDGSWEYGDLHLHCAHPHIHTLNVYRMYIDPKTVGQFTGLHDKNGKEIYEGDILRSKRKTLNYIAYDDDKGRFVEVRIWDAAIDARCEISKYKIERLGQEVIGNIHDNPELLKGGIYAN